MRFFSLAALVLFAAAQQQSNPHVRTTEPSLQERNAQAEENQKQQESKQVPTTAIQECERCTVIEKCIGCAAEGDPNAQQKNGHAYDPRKDTLYRAYLWATIGGVVVALGGIYAIYRQTKATKDAAIATQDSADATRHSAQATERSVKLQENTQRQWVNLEEWHAYRFDATKPLEIAFDVVNPTGLPLTLHLILTTANGKEVEERGFVTLITPDNPFKHSFPFQPTQEQETLYDKGALSIDVDCRVFFADSHGIHWEQQFGRRLLCARGSIGPVVTDTKNAMRESGVPGEHGSRDVELP